MCHSIYPPYSRREPFGPSEPSNSGIAQRCTSPTMPSADFCAAVGSPRGLPSPEFETRHRPPRLSLTTFLRTAGFTALAFDGWRTSPSSVGSSHQHCLLSDSCSSGRDFAPHFLQTPCHQDALAFANPSPPSSWIRDLHPQVEKHAWQTKKKGGLGRPPYGKRRVLEGAAITSSRRRARSERVTPSIGRSLDCSFGVRLRLELTQTSSA